MCGQYLVFAFLLLFNSMLGQINEEYEVINYRGSIFNETTQDYLKKKSLYQKKDQLIFSKDDCRLAVLNQAAQLFIVRPFLDKGIFVPKYRMLPFYKNGRNGVITNSISLNLNVNEDSLYLVVGEKCQVEISPHFFEMREDNFFYLRYYWQGDTINKKLPIKDNALIFSKSEIFSARYNSEEPRFGKDTIVTIPEEEASGFELHCVCDNPYSVFSNPGLPDDLQNRTYLPIRLQFLDTEVVKKEVAFLLDVLAHKEGVPEGQILDRIHAGLESYFNGKIEKGNLKDWLDEYFR